jgi:hypothetical protein
MVTSCAPANDPDFENMAISIGPPDAMKASMKDSWIFRVGERASAPLPRKMPCHMVDTYNAEITGRTLAQNEADGA